MTIDERMFKALQATGIEVTQRPVTGTAAEYLSWTLTSGSLTASASNQPQRMRYLITVDFFSRVPPDPERVIGILRALAAGGVRPTHWGPTDYEPDTRWYHTPISGVRTDDYNMEG